MHLSQLHTLKTGPDGPHMYSILRHLNNDDPKTPLPSSHITYKVLDHYKRNLKVKTTLRYLGLEKPLISLQQFLKYLGIEKSVMSLKRRIF